MEGEVVELPYRAEYAKTGRASCKGCKSSIAQDKLRISVMVQSAFHDGKQPNWFHEKCFFQKQRPSSIGDIDNIANLRFEDQERIRTQIDQMSSVVPAGKKSKGKKRTQAENASAKDYGIEYAKSGRAVCRGCELKILKDEVRIRKTVFDTEVGMKYGGQALWHHIQCFAQVREELGWFETGEKLPGFSNLTTEDQKEVKKAIPAIKSDNMPLVKKAKLEPKDEQEQLADKQLADKMKSQNERYFKFRDAIADIKMPFAVMNQLLEANKQTPIVGDRQELLNQLVDLLTFGALAACTECKGTQILFRKSIYLCNGDLTEWTKCTQSFKEPLRTPCKVSKELKQEYTFLKKVGKKPETRIILYTGPSASTIAKSVALKKEDQLDGPKVKRERPPLYNFRFAQIGLKQNESELKTRIIKLGGKYDSKITKDTVAIFSTDKDVKSLKGRMVQAQELGIHIIPIEYLDSVESNGINAINYISSMTICDWGTDPAARIPQEEAKSSKSKSIYTKSVPKSMTLKIKDGLAVDPDSHLEDVAHVYVKGDDKYNVILGLTNFQTNKNSYYKLQLLQSDTSNKYWVFRSWGRIGTTIGDTKTENFSSLNEAQEVFMRVYLDKTGNHFANRQNFQKVTGKMYPIDVAYTEDTKIDLNVEHDIKSKLDPTVQSLIKLLFDIDTMKRTMMEFNIDMEKMPLGKLSSKQIQSAYSVLTEVYKLIQEGGSNSRFIDVTNRFYTLIPHNFGIDRPPLLDTAEQIENLRQMLDSLMEIECAYNLLTTPEDTDKNINPIDKHYEQLKTKLDPLDKSSEEFALLQKYVKNTHAATHKMYDLEVVDIFKVARQGEARRYKPFKKLHNRKLLWHGSRLTNFAGILSHGLKIAPPEAPVTGYMFGKGIYFADMVSKSANYCCTSNQNSTGLMLLSEVALGDMMELTQAKYINKLPTDKHSCFGRGTTMPDPKESYKRKDGVEIPLGKPNTDAKLKSSLLYNEYIVYDIAQVNIQYLFRMNFKYNY